MSCCETKTQMIPIGALMIEHRIIDRMVGLLENEFARIRDTGEMSPKFINSALDFLKVYADRCHHGKEEEIFFKALETKPLSAEESSRLKDLISDHIRARMLVEKISGRLKEAYGQRRPEAIKSIASLIDDLTKLYRAHVQKEDKQFFIPVMKYFTKQEQDEMLCAFWEFDRKLIHEKYKDIVAQMEKEE